MAVLPSKCMGCERTFREDEIPFIIPYFAVSYAIFVVCRECDFFFFFLFIAFDLNPDKWCKWLIALERNLDEESGNVI